MGTTQIEYYEKTSKIDVNGREMFILRRVPPTEMAERHSAGATADDLAGAARDLGLTEDEIAQCDNP